MSTPEPPVTGDEQQPEQGTTPAPAKRAPRRTTPKAPATSAPSTAAPSTPAPDSAAPDSETPAAEQTPAAEPSTVKPAAAKPATTKSAAAKPAVAKSTAAKPAATKPATRKPAARTTARRPATGRAVPKPDEQGDVPSILDTALAAHNASVRGSIVNAESEEAPPSPTASAAQQRAARHQTAQTTRPAETTPPAAEPVANVADENLPATTELPAVEQESAGQAAEQQSANEPTTEPFITEQFVTQTEPSEPEPAEPVTADQPTVALPATELPTASTEFPPPSASAAADATGTLPPDGEASHPRSVTDIADRLDDTRFFSSLFDFTFTNYVTRKLAGPVYVVGLVLIGLSTLLSIVYSLTAALNTHSFLGAFVFLFGVIITLVGAILAVLLLRVGIEVFVAIIEIAQNTRGRKKPRP
jgi:hypothetical protein